MRRDRLARLTIAAFSLRQVRRGAIIVGILFGIAAVSQTTGLAKAYPTPEARGQLISSLKTNVGLRLLFGSTEHLDNTIASYANWRILGIITVIGSIWGILVTSRLLRGEEENGRWELLLSSPVTARQATRRTIAGIYGGAAIIGLLASLALGAAGRSPDVDIGWSAAGLFALTMLAGDLMFVGIAAVTSQLAGTRSRAAMLASSILGILFLLRAIANVSESAHWLRRFNPLSWIDNIRPLTDHQTIWLLPIAGLTVASISLAVFLSGRRDLLGSFLPQQDSARARPFLLRTPFRFALRSTRGAIVSWLLAITFPAVVFGMLTATAGDILTASQSFTNALDKTFGQSAISGEKLFLGMGFLLIAVFAMILAAAAVQGIRKEEARETLDNLLVQPVRRLQWLAGRCLIAGLWVAAACLWASLACWAVASFQHVSLSITVYLTAGITIIAPALCMLGIGLAAFGLWPRLTAGITYGIIGWSFLAEILGSVLDIPRWVLDTSILHHLAAVPAVDPNWVSAGLMVGLGVALTGLGAWAFNRRDLQNE